MRYETGLVNSNNFIPTGTSPSGSVESNLPTELIDDSTAFDSGSHMDNWKYNCC